MPLFGGTKRPALDGLTKDEEKRRDALTAEVMRRATDGVGQDNAILDVLRERVSEEPNEALWPLVLGWRLMAVQHYSAAMVAFDQAIERQKLDVRPRFGYGMASYRAARARQSLGAGVTDEMVPFGVAAVDLYQQAIDRFKSALELTTDKAEAARLHDAMNETTKELARSRPAPAQKLGE